MKNLVLIISVLRNSVLSVVLGLSLVATLLIPEVALAEAFFKLTNEQGRTVIKETLTPDEARRGYEIISKSGNVVKVVAPELSEEDYNAMTEAQKLAMIKKENEEREARYNLDLLLKYSNLNDLQAERERKLREFDISISILRGNLAVLRENAERQRSVAASIERNGHPVPEKIQGNIAEIEREMNEARESVEKRKEEKQAISAKYDADALRLESLLKKKVTAKR